VVSDHEATPPTGVTSEATLVPLSSTVTLTIDEGQLTVTLTVDPDKLVVKLVRASVEAVPDP
jgi:hypothetical protein